MGDKKKSNHNTVTDSASTTTRKRTTTLAAIAVALALVAAMSALMTGLLLPKNSWKSGTTIVTLSKDGTLTVRARRMIDVSPPLLHNWRFAIGDIIGKGRMRDYGVVPFGDSKLTGFGDTWEQREWNGGVPPWHGARGSITCLVIEKGVRYIGQEAFSGLNKLNSVTIGEGVSAIGSKAFANCAGLASVTIPGNVSIIGDYAFAWSGLASVTIEEGVEQLGSGAFENCAGLTTVAIPNSVKWIGWRAFKDCAGLTSVSIGSGLQKIESDLFSGCENLTSINVSGDNTEYSSIDGVLFNKDKNILIRYPQGRQGAYTVPNGAAVGWWTFENCAGLTAINVDDDNFRYSSIDGVLFNKTKDTLILYPSGKQGAYTMPSSVAAIKMRAFDNCPGLTSINVDDGNFRYSSIDGVLFNKTKDTLILYPSGKQGASYAIPNSVAAIGHSAFARSGIGAVTIPSGVKSIGGFAFSNCANLTSAEIGSGVTYIELMAFADCAALKTVISLNPVPAGTQSRCGNSHPIDCRHDASVFKNVAACLYVPENSIDAYRAHMEWNVFECIKPLGDAPNK